MNVNWNRNYRVKNLFALEKDLLQELEWLNGVSLSFHKNYQIWYGFFRCCLYEYIVSHVITTGTIAKCSCIHANISR